MAKLIGFGRCTGKTTMAILESHATGNRIVVPNNRSKKYILQDSARLGYVIPYPLTVQELHSGKNRLESNLIVDDVERLLEAILGTTVATITFNSRELDFGDHVLLDEVMNLKAELDKAYADYKGAEMALAQSFEENIQLHKDIDRLHAENMDLLVKLGQNMFDEVWEEEFARRANKRKFKSR